MLFLREKIAFEANESEWFITDFEKIKKQGDTAIKNWIDRQLEGTSVTVVLVGEKTCNSRWVEYERKKSIEKGNGLLGIDISGIKDLQGKISERCGQIPKGYAFYLCNKEEGSKNMGNWIAPRRWQGIR